MRWFRAWALGTSVCGLMFSSVFAASKPDPVNADFFANPNKIETIALIVDTLIVEDIEGSDGGIYRSDHDALVPVIAHGVKEAIEDRGYRVAELHGNAGLFGTEHLKLVYAERDYKSSGKSVMYPLYPANVPAWAQGPVQAVMGRVMEGAGPKRRPKQSFKVELPEEIKTLPVDAIAIVSSSASNLSLDKTLGLALLTGVAFGLAGFPSMDGIPAYATVYSGQSSVITIVDVRDGTVLWFDEGSPSNSRAGGTRMIRHTLVNLLIKLPNRDATAAAATSEGASVSTSRPHLADQPSIFTDVAGYSAAALRNALRAQKISRDDYKMLARKMELDYRERLQALEDSLRNEQITEREHDIEEFRWNWAYRGFF